MHFTEGVWDSAETGNNHWDEVVKVIRRNVGHVLHPRSSVVGVTPGDPAIFLLIITGMADFDIYLAYQRNVQNVSFNVLFRVLSSMTITKVAPPLAAIMALTELIEKSSGATLMVYITTSSS